jgi:IBR domain, a half RING-finger domain/Ring finger domain
LKIRVTKNNIISKSNLVIAMAAFEDERDALRYSTEYPLLQQMVAEQSGGSDASTETIELGTLSAVKERAELLLDAALSTGSDEIRVANLVQLLGQLNELEVEAMRQLSFQEDDEQQQQQVDNIGEEKTNLSDLRLSVQVPTSSPYRAMLHHNTTSGSPVLVLPGDQVNANVNDDGDGVGDDAHVNRGEHVELAPAVDALAGDDGAEPLECPICYDEVEPADVRVLMGCSHRYCKDCLDAHFGAKIAEAQIDDLSCPNPDCDAKAQEYELQSLLSAETYAKYGQFAVLNQIRDDPNAVYCPNKSCLMPIIWDPEQPKVTCPACTSIFCFSCKKPWHEGVCRLSDLDLDDADREFVQYVKDQGTDVKTCPRCNIATHKTSGCNRMFQQQIIVRRKASLY